MTWPACAETEAYQRWRDEQLAAAPRLSDGQRAQIVAAVVADQKPTRRAAS